MTGFFWLRRMLPGFVALTALSGCGGGGGGGDDDAAITPPGPAPATVQVRGLVSFERVPVSTITSGLDYDQTEASPARQVVVRALEADSGVVLDEAVTSTAGRYRLEVPVQTSVIVRARAQMLATGAPGWDFRVVDNTAGGALYVLDAPSFDSGSADSVRDLVAGSGWTGSAYTETRAAAPFAMLDDLYEARDLVLSVDPDAVFPPLEINWSVDNKPTSGSFEDGNIGTSFFRRTGDGRRQIFVLGWADNDTDEYDRHVVTHEWGHYFEDAFSRSDSIGGPHGIGDVLDPRVAFGEGFGNAFAGMVLDDPVYRDSQGVRQSFGFSNSVEVNTNTRAGWYSEGSVESILYDLYDADDDGTDVLELGFAPLYEVLNGTQRETDYFTTVFSFIAALKAARPGAADQIDALVAAQDMQATSMNPRGSTQTNNGGNAEDVLPVYTQVQVDGGAARVCSTPEFGTVNKLSNRRFLEFRVALPGQHRIVANAVGDAIAQAADPDMALYRQGAIAVSESTLPDIETLTSPMLQPGTHLIDLYEYTNITTAPRGRTCFDVSVSRQ